MSSLAIILVLIAAVLHAVWNFLAKGAQDSSAFMWWGITVGALWYGAIIGAQFWLGLPSEIWLGYAFSLTAEVGYVIFINRGYANGDLSQVYPIARGAPPMFIALWSALFLGERLPWLGYAGIAVLIVGIYLASLPALADLGQPLRALSHRPAQWAALAAVCVSIYSTIDKLNVAHVAPLVYNWWVYAGIAVAYAPFVWRGARRAVMAREIKTNGRRIALGSLATVGSYLLALTGMSMTAASYVGAVRATSVVIGAVLGWLWLKESFGPVRVFAAALMVVGLLMVAVA